MRQQTIKVGDYLIIHVDHFIQTCLHYSKDIIRYYTALKQVLFFLCLDLESPDGQSTSERTCGIICCLCDNLVTKSYSCYRRENAPEKIKHFFTPGVKIVKVCRRCMPYKKPKEEVGAAGTAKGKTKAMKGKLAKIKSAKLIKNSKATAKGNMVKASEKKGVEKSVVESPTKDGKKRKSNSQEDISRVPPAKKQFSVVEQMKKMPVPREMVMKLTNAKPVQGTLRCTVLSKEVTKSDGGKSNTLKGVNTSVKVMSALPKSKAQESDNNMGVADKCKNSTAEEETAVTIKLKSEKVDSGTQSMKSMIGINRVKSKSEDAAATNKGTVKENKPGSVSSNEEVANKSVRKDSDIEHVSLKCEEVTDHDCETKKPDKDEMLKGETTSGARPEETVTEIKKDDSEMVLLKEPEDGKIESKDTEVSKGIKEEKEDAITESQNVTDNMNTRERRSASKSPVRAREVKPVEVSSPRRGRSSGTPDKKREDYKQIMPTIMTRKRLASFSETEVKKKGESNTATGTTAGKRPAVVALLEKMSRKSGESSSIKVKEEGVGTTASVKVKREVTDMAESPEEEGTVWWALFHSGCFCTLDSLPNVMILRINCAIVNRLESRLNIFPIYQVYFVFFF